MIRIFQSAETRRKAAESEHLEKIRGRMEMALAALAGLPYGTALRVMSDAIVTHSHAAAPATRIFAQSIDQHADRIERENENDQR